MARLAFTGSFKATDGKDVDHIDGDKTHDHLLNLRLVTHKTNSGNRDTLALASKMEPIRLVIENATNAKTYVFANACHAADELGVNQRNLWRFVKGTREYPITCERPEELRDWKIVRAEKLDKADPEYNLPLMKWAELEEKANQEVREHFAQSVSDCRNRYTDYR